MDRRHVSYPTLFFAAGTSLGIGWAMGSWSACGSRCSFDTALFEAIGTWVGGVGIAAAASGYLWTRNRRDDERDARRVWHEAHLCTLRSRPLQIGDSWSKIQVEFTNPLSAPVAEVSMHLVGGPVLRGDSVVASSRTWGHSVSVEEIGLSVPPNEAAARALINGEVRPNLVFIFSLEGHRFLRSGRDFFRYADAPTELLPASGVAVSEPRQQSSTRSSSK